MNSDISRTMSSSLRDNRPARGSVGDFLRAKIRAGADLSFVSAYFTVNAYDALKEALERAGSLRFLFGEPAFISDIDPDKHEKKNFRLTDESLELAIDQSGKNSKAWSRSASIASQAGRRHILTLASSMLARSKAT